MNNSMFENISRAVEERASKVAAKVPANETPQLELLYRDIRIQMEELNELRPYKEAVEEMAGLLEQYRWQNNFNGFSHANELLIKIDLILKETKK